MELYQRDYLTSRGEWRAEWVPVPTPVPLHVVIRGALLNALAYTAGDQAHAAALLGLSTRTMGYQMDTHQIPGAMRGGVGPKRPTRNLPKTRRPKES